MKKVGAVSTRERTKNMVYTALFAALIAVMAQISISLPSGVPLTMQTFAVAFAGFFLGWKRGFAALAVYVALGAIGVPVFASFTGGVQKLVGVTGGFIWGFVVHAVMSGLPLRRKSAAGSICCSLVGLALCHMLGVTQFSLISGTEWSAAALAVSVPYIAKDVVSVLAAYIVAVNVKKRVRYPSEDNGQYDKGVSL